MDGDVVDVSNLQRQMLHTTANVGRPKVESGARDASGRSTRTSTSSRCPTRIDVDNVMDIIKDYDLVIDGSDNFDTRYLVNDACYLGGQDQRPRLHLPVRGHGHRASPRTRARATAASIPTPPPPGLVPS